MARSDTSPPAASLEALPILSGCSAYSSALRPEFQLYFSTLATTNHISTLLPASLNGKRNVPRFHVELQSMTVVLLQEQWPRQPDPTQNTGPNLAPGTYNDASNLSLGAFMAAEMHFSTIVNIPLKIPQMSVTRKDRKITWRETMLWVHHTWAISTCIT